MREAAPLKVRKADVAHLRRSAQAENACLRPRLSENLLREERLLREQAAGPVLEGLSLHLPPGHVLTVRIEDVSRADAPAARRKSP